MKKFISILCLMALLVGCLSFYSCDSTPADKGSDTYNEHSDFDTSEWTGDVQRPASDVTYLPENFVVPQRLEGETDDSPAINRALETIKEKGTEEVQNTKYIRYYNKKYYYWNEKSTGHGQLGKWTETPSVNRHNAYEYFKSEVLPQLREVYKAKILADVAEKGAGFYATKIEEIKRYCIDKKYDILTIDGVKVNFKDGFALVRASNTGPNITMRYEERRDAFSNQKD